MNRVIAALKGNLFWWLAPVVVLVGLVVLLLVRAGSTGSPFIYSPF